MWEVIAHEIIDSAVEPSGRWADALERTYRSVGFGGCNSIGGFVMRLSLGPRPAPV